MRLAVTSRLPLVWGGDFVDQANIRVCPHGELRAKVLLFKHRLAMRRWWIEHTTHRLERDCLASVNSLSHTVTSFHTDGSESSRLEVDARFFCVIGLVLGLVSMEIIAHESVHAGFAYSRRRARTPWDRHINEMEEEAVAYPAGRVARQINIFMNEGDYYS